MRNILLIYVFAVSCSALWAQGKKEAIYQDLDWAINNQTNADQVNCPEQYVNVHHPECVAEGGRACLMRNAIREAKRHECSKALDIVKVTQCHENADPARRRIAEAGTEKVCSYLASQNLDPTPRPPNAKASDPAQDPTHKNKTADRVGPMK